MKRKLLVLGISLMLVLTWVSFPVPVTAAPKIIYVDVDASGGSGGTWADAFNNLQDALTAASAGDQIWVAEGTYKPGTLRTDTFRMKNWVEIYGGFDGTESDRSQRNPDLASNVTILSGDIGTPDDTTDNSYHVLYADGGITENAILDRFTITAGNANGGTTFPNNYGGGMYIEESSPTLTDCTFTGNLSDKHGGGIYNNFYSSPVLTNCTFSGNSATTAGGGMYNTLNSTPTLTNCTFSNNKAGYGGGMYNSGSNPELTGCIFNDNNEAIDPDGDGGGMTNLNSSPVLTNCNFIGNSANGDGGGMVNFTNSEPVLEDCSFSGNSAAVHGGGMYNEDTSSPILTGCVFDGNSAGTSGGGMFSYAGCIPDLEDCTFSGNSAIMWGGGMLNYNTGPTLENCTFSLNEVTDPTGDGGGIYNLDSNATIINCNFSGNLAPDLGGGICNEAGSPALTDCTFSDNSANYGGGIYNFSDSSPTLTDCTFSGNQADDSGGGIDNQSSNPILTGCIFIGNSAAYGGGMSNYNVISPTLINCAFSGNSASYGGGMYNEESDNPILANCTFSGNSASTEGGGIYNFSNSNQTLTNCILWGNSDIGGTDESAQIHSYINSSSAVDYCCLRGWSGLLGGTGNIGGDPLFVDADGENDILGDTDDNLRLSVGSPCIDAGYNDGVPAGVTTDLDGAPRIFDGDHDENPVVDMGAYEYRSGVIDVTSTPEGAGFTITGAADYSGTTPWTESDAPIGEYTITWEDLPGYTKPSPDVKTLTEGVSISFNGVYVQDEYTLTVNVVGNGTVTKNPDQVTYTFGTSIDLTAAADTGWMFSGWSGDLTGSTNPKNITMDSDKIVTATFTAIPPDEYILTLNVVGSGTVTKNPDQVTYTSGTSVQLTATADTGWAFSDWSGDLTGSTNPETITMDSNKTVTATFAEIPPDEYTLTVNKVGSGSVTLDPVLVTYASGTSVQLTAAADTGWTFSGWSDDLSGSTNPETITMDGDKTVTATFIINTYTLTYEAGSNGTLTGDTGQTVNHGEDGTAVTAVPGTGYQFVDWSDGVADNPRTDTNVTSDISVTANFAVIAPATYNLTYTAGSNGTLTGDAAQTVNQGEDGTAVEAVPDTGYKFVDWSDGSTDNPRTDTSVTSDISVTANFTAIPTDVGTIHVNSDPEGMSFTLSGPDNYSYSGETPWDGEDAPAGEYTITWDEMEGYDTPSPTTKTLEKDGSISFDNDTSGGGGLSGGAIAWIVVGSIAGLAVVFFALKQWVFKG